MTALHAAVPATRAARLALCRAPSRAMAEDLMFLEAWERDAMPGSGAALRVTQIRRANPELAAAIRAELMPARRG